MAKDEVAERDERNARFTMQTMQLMSLKPLDVRICQPQELEERCIYYFQTCNDNNTRPSIAGFAFAIGIGRDTLLRYIRGESKCPLDNLQVINRFYMALNAMIEDYMQSGAINPVSGIFLMKNNFSYKDTQDFVVNNKQETVISEDKLLEEANLLTESKPKLANIEE